MSGESPSVLETDSQMVSPLPIITPSPEIPKNIEIVDNIQNIPLSKEQASNYKKIGAGVVVMFILSNFIAKDVGSDMKRISFFIFLSYMIISAYSLSIKKLKGNSNLVLQIEYLVRNVSDFIMFNKHIEDHGTMDTFLRNIMREHSHVYAIWVCFEKQEKDCYFAYRNNIMPTMRAAPSVFWARLRWKAPSHILQFKSFLHFFNSRKHTR